MLKFDELPALPENDRIMVLPDAPKKTTEGGIEIPEDAQRHANYGVVVAAGLKASDVLHDHGGRIGDRIWFGQYAGVIEEWDHIIKAGKKRCKHDWARAPEMFSPRRTGYRCKCGAVRMQEPLLIMNVEDILANVTKAERVRSGETILVCGATAEGRTQHVFMTPGVPREGFTSTLTNGVAHAS